MVKNKDDKLLAEDGKTPNPDTSWEKVNGTISSIPYASHQQIEQWFTNQHTHDSGANNDIAKNPILILPKSIRSKIGYTDEVVYKKGVDRNTLVNFNKVTAKERGIDLIVIDTSKYSGKEPVTLEFISEQWIYSDFW